MRETIIREWTNSWHDPKWDNFYNIFEEDVYYSESWGPEYCGIEEIRTWFSKWHTHSKLEKWEIKNILNVDKCSVVEWYFSCFDDNEISGFDGVSIIEWSDNGKIASLKEFGSKLPKYRVF